MKIKFADGSRLDFKDNLVPLFDLLAGYRETFGEDAGGAEIDLSSNEELTLPAFMRAMVAIHNPTLSSATIAADTMKTLNYLGYKTCAPLMDPLPNSDTYIAFCACYSRGAAVDMSGHTRPPANEEFERAVRIHTIIAGGEVPRDDNFRSDLQQAWCCVGRHGVKSLELFRFVEKYGEYSDHGDMLPLAVPAFWRLPSAARMISHTQLSCDLDDVRPLAVPAFWRPPSTAGTISHTPLSWDLEELAQCADDPVELRAAVVQFVVSHNVIADGTQSVLPETREELDIWLAHDPKLSRIAASERELVELVKLIDAEFPHARFCAPIEMAIAIVKDYPERYNSATAAISVIPRILAFLRLERDPPKIAAASDPEHNRALLSRAAGGYTNAVRAFTWREAKSSIFADGAWGHSAMRYLASPGDPMKWLEGVFASRDPGWLPILRYHVDAAVKRYPANVIKYVGSIAAYDIFHKWRECPPNVFVEGDFIVGIRVMAELVAAGRASESDAAANLQKFLRRFHRSQPCVGVFLDDLLAADAMLPDGIVSHMLRSGWFVTSVVRDLIRIGAKWNYDDIREIKGRCLQLERLIA